MYRSKSSFKSNFTISSSQEFTSVLNRETAKMQKVVRSEKNLSEHMLKNVYSPGQWYMFLYHSENPGQRQYYDNVRSRFFALYDFLPKDQIQGKIYDFLKIPNVVGKISKKKLHEIYEKEQMVPRRQKLQVKAIRVRNPGFQNRRTSTKEYKIFKTKREVKNNVRLREKHTQELSSVDCTLDERKKNRDKFPLSLPLFNSGQQALDRGIFKGKYQAVGDASKKRQDSDSDCDIFTMAGRLSAEVGDHVTGRSDLNVESRSKVTEDRRTIRELSGCSEEESDIIEATVKTSEMNFGEFPKKKVQFSEVEYFHSGSSQSGRTQKFLDSQSVVEDTCVESNEKKSKTLSLPIYGSLESETKVSTSYKSENSAREMFSEMILPSMAESSKVVREVNTGGVQLSTPGGRNVEKSEDFWSRLISQKHLSDQCESQSSALTEYFTDQVIVDLSQPGAVKTIEEHYSNIFQLINSQNKRQDEHQRSKQLKAAQTLNVTSHGDGDEGVSVAGALVKEGSRSTMQDDKGGYSSDDSMYCNDHDTGYLSPADYDHDDNTAQPEGEVLEAVPKTTINEEFPSRESAETVEKGDATRKSVVIDEMKKPEKMKSNLIHFQQTRKSESLISCSSLSSQSRKKYERLAAKFTMPHISGLFFNQPDMEAILKSKTWESDDDESMVFSPRDRLSVDGNEQVAQEPIIRMDTDEIVEVDTGGDLKSGKGERWRQVKPIESCKESETSVTTKKSLKERDVHDSELEAPAEADTQMLTYRKESTEFESIATLNPNFQSILRIYSQDKGLPSELVLDYNTPIRRRKVFSPRTPGVPEDKRPAPTSRSPTIENLRIQEVEPDHLTSHRTRENDAPEPRQHHDQRISVVTSSVMTLSTNHRDNMCNMQ